MERTLGKSMRSEQLRTTSTRQWHEAAELKRYLLLIVLDQSRVTTLRQKCDRNATEMRQV
jgi:hypothetical protein